MRLHEAREGFAAAKTTLDFTTGAAPIHRANVLIVTGAGRNRDVLSAFDYAVAAEARSVLAVCAAKSSVLARRAKSHWHTDVFDFSLPSRRDGFLATNSLLATCLLLARAFGCDVSSLKDNYGSAKFEQRTANLIPEQAKTLLVLHSGWSTPAAVDLESKCSEAALRAVLLSDYRHFAHGRHQWLATHESASAVIAFVTPEEAELADKTLKLLPAHLPVLRLQTALRGAAATVDLLLQTFHLVAGLGRVAGIDPGRPGVPRLGGRLYHLRAQVDSPLLRVNAENVRTVAIRRKKAANVLSVDWDLCYDTFVTRLCRARFSAAVFDFDGTLCGSRDRFDGLSKILQPFILGLASTGVLIGIATGRGKSAREALQNVLPRQFWTNVLVGYHNGTEVAALANNHAPDTNREVSMELSAAHEVLRCAGLEKHCKLSLRPMQLTIEPYSAWEAAKVSMIVQETVAKFADQLRLVHSSHSLDVLARGASKLNVVSACREQNGEVLCFGDRGSWPGNDFEMLATPFSLSVDAVSADPQSCWNLAPTGVRCVQATAFYLAGIRAVAGKFRYSLTRSLAWFKTQKHRE